MPCSTPTDPRLVAMWKELTEHPYEEVLANGGITITQSGKPREWMQFLTTLLLAADYVDPLRVAIRAVVTNPKFDTPAEHPPTAAPVVDVQSASQTTGFEIQARDPHWNEPTWTCPRCGDKGFLRNGLIDCKETDCPGGNLLVSRHPPHPDTDLAADDTPQAVFYPPPNLM